MITYLLVSGKTALALAIFFLFYKGFLGKDKLFIRNRLYLLGTSLLSFVLPWINIPLIQSPETGTILTFTYLEGNNPATTQHPGQNFSNLPIAEIIFYLYLTGALVFFMKALFAYFQVFRIIKNAFCLPLGKQKMAITRKKVSPFSFMNWLVISEETQQHPSFEKMVQHELIHSRQYHSVDLLIAEILIILQWFNPFTWLIRKSIMENLEFIVDNEILAVGTDAREYQYSLLHFSMAGLRPAVANNFSTNLLKKRITMMNKNKYNGKHRLHNFLIPVVLISAMLTTVSFKKEGKADIMNMSNFPTNLIKEKSRIKPETEVTSPKKDNHLRPEVSQDSKAIETFLGYIMNHITYPKGAIDINLGSKIEIPVRFKANGVEILKEASTEGERLKQIVVLGYRNAETAKHSPAGSNSKEIAVLQNEVIKVLNSYLDVPKELVGKIYIISVNFILDEPRVIGYANNPNENNTDEQKLQIRSVDNLSNTEPVYILNDEKIITKEEMQNINPETIQSVEVRKNGYYKNEKVGEIKSSVVIITLKK